MKTRFDKITESPKSLADFILDITDNSKPLCDFCSSKDNKRCDAVSCKANFTEWLNQPVPMNEQFTYVDISYANLLRKSSNMYIARDMDGSLYLYNGKPQRDKEEWIIHNTNIEHLHHSFFSYIRWEDEPVLLEDIINSKEIKK